MFKAGLYQITLKLTRNGSLFAFGVLLRTGPGVRYQKPENCRYVVCNNQSDSLFLNIDFFLQSSLFILHLKEKGGQKYTH